MGLRDIVLGVDFDLSAATTKGNLLVESMRFLSQQAREAQQDFETLEATAHSLGRTYEAHTGITKDTADVYRDLRKSSADLDTAWRGLRQTALAPLNKELDEFNRRVLNIINATQDGNLLEFLGGIIKDPFGKRSTQPTDAQLRERANQQLGEDIAAGASISREFREGVAAARERAAERLQAQQLREQTRLQFQEIDRHQFAQFQAIDRATFVRQQQLELQNPNVSSSVIAEQQRIRLQQFDLRQQSAQQKAAIREAAAGQRAAITTANNTQKTNDELVKAVELLTEIRDQRIEENPFAEEFLIDEVDGG